MPTESPGAALDVDQIAFVTRRYEELHGLLPAACGASMVLAAAALHFLHASTAYAMSPFLTMMLLFNAQSFAIDETFARYTETFGRTEAAPFEFAQLASWTTIYVSLGMLLDYVVVGLAAPVHWPSSAGIGLLLSSGLILLIDGRWRPYYIVPFFAGVVAIAMTVGVAPVKPTPSWESDPVRTPVFMLAHAFVGLGLVTAGVLDHRLLTTTLTPHWMGHGTSAEARRASATFRTTSAGLVCACALLTMCFPASEMAVVLPLSLVIVTSFGVRRWLRLMRRVWGLLPDRVDNPEPFGLHPHTLVMFILFAIAAIVDTVFMRPAPLALTIVFAMSCFWIALRDWPSRKAYLIGAALPLLVLPAAMQMPSARAFTLLLLVSAAALMVGAFFDGRGGKSSESIPEGEHADPI